MSLKKAEKPQDVLYIKVASINTESQKTPAECRLVNAITPAIATTPITTVSNFIFFPFYLLAIASWLI